MESKRLKFGYEDTDYKIEIDLYGIVFEIDKEKIINKDIKNINENDEDTVKKEIEKVIGIGSVEKINNKRLSDGYKKMTLDVEIAVLTCIYKTYITATSGTMVDEIIETNRNMENKAKNLGNINREQRRNYSKNQYRGNRRNYRRY